MEKLNLSKVCQDLISVLPDRQKEVILRRFGFGEFKERQTLEEIGQKFQITRERVRQIQEDAFSRMEEKRKKYKDLYKFFERYFLKFGGLKREKILFEDLGEKKWEKEIYFLLSLDKKFERYPEKKEYFAFWALKGDFVERAKKNIELLCQKLREIKKPVSFKEINFLSLPKPYLISLLEITKLIQKNEDGLYGLKEWPEISPRGVKDKAYLALKKVKKPLHFTEIAKLIEGAHLQTVHNELIKDERFVLVGRGIYALREWGYEPGFVKDLIIKILKEKGPLEKDKILKEVLKQRMVKENTVLLNLSNRKYFERDSQGKYRLKPGLI
jgi:hypothetical protein